jgi:TRAP-type C4-dicarboxylate transport system permease small subunit
MVVNPFQENLMLSIARSIESLIHSISRRIRWVSMGTLFLMMFFVAAGVIARYIMSRPIKGDMEIQELGMVLVVFVALSFLQSEKGNVYVELLVDRLKGRSKAILQSFAYLIGLGIIVLIIWQTGVKAVRDFASFGSNVTPSLYIPKAPFLLIADIGLALFGIEWLIELIHCSYRAIVSKQPQKAYVPEHESVGSS